jgi:RNA polymerase sigma-70 factor (ECF subfamily)
MAHPTNATKNAPERARIDLGSTDRSAPANASSTSQRARDLELVQDVVAGAPGSFDELHRLYRDRVYAFALRRLRDSAEAEDVCQDVFLQIFKSIGTFQGRSSLLTWIFGITHHQICRRHRRRAPLTLSLDAPEAIELSADQVPSDRRVDAARALEDCGRVLEEKVTEAQRQVFHLHYKRNCSTRDIAEQLGKSRQAVKISLFRTRRTLSAEMASRGLLSA